MTETLAQYGALLSFVLFIVLLMFFVLHQYRHKKWLQKVFLQEDASILQEERSDKINFETKLIQAGLTKKEFFQIVALSIFTGVSIASLVFILHLSPVVKALLVFFALSIAVATPFIYLDEQKKARIKRIERDLAIFIDLLIIILEGGGGLHNAIDQVTEDAKDIIGKDLLEESKRFKYEFITYDSELAYNNLVKRTGSEAIATIVGFMRLSQETGIGVKSVFENQSNEIKEADLLNLEKKAAMMNVSLTFTMFLFILPAIIAMIVFPISAGAILNLKF